MLKYKIALLVVIAVFLANIPIALAQTDIKSQFELIKQSALDYEGGKISYLELKVQADVIGEKIRRSVSEGVVKIGSGEKQFEGLKTETIESLLGPPTERTTFIWVVNEEKAANAGKELPGWRKEIFNGQKIKITVNAWPQIFRSAEGDKVFYWLGFEFFFKKEESFNPEQVSVIKNKVEEYYRTGQGAVQLAKEIATVEKSLQNYLEENREACVKSAEELVKGERFEQLNNRREGSLYSGKNINLKINSNGCADCKDWAWMDINFWIESYDRSYTLEEPQIPSEAENSYKSKQLSELYFELEQAFEKIKRDAERYDKTKYNAFSEDYRTFRLQVHSIMRTLDEKVNSWEISDGKKSELRKERKERIDRIFQRFVTDLKSEVVKQVENKKRLLTIKETKTDTHCETRFDECGPEMMCTAGPKCVQRPQEPREDGKICPAVCRGIWEIRDSACVFNGCGSGCGPDGTNSFSTKEECENNLAPPITTTISTTTTSAQTTTTAPAAVNETTTTVPTAETTTSTTAPQTTTTAAQTTTSSTTSTTSSTTSTTTGPTGGATGFQIVDESSCVKNGCNQNQVCNAEKGWCECSRGSFDCDGDWRNGCESDKQCTPCRVGDQCAPPRCEPTGGGIERFVCVQGEPREEEVAGFEMGATCGFKQSGGPDTGVWFSGWGERFEKLEGLKRAGESNTGWCERELFSALEERKEIEKSFKSGFLESFMDDSVAENPEDFEIYGRSFGGLFWGIVDNNRKIAENLQCLHKIEWPEAELINAKVETKYGKIELSESFIETDYFGEKMRVLTPTMKMWMFPPKEVFKKFFFQELREGKLGPDGEGGGPSPAEIAEMKQSKEVMEVVKRISDRFGGEANIIFSVKDNNQELFKMLMKVNEEEIMQVKPALDYTGEVDVTLSMDFDFFYNMISSMEKGKASHTERPPWDNRIDSSEGISDAAEGIAFFTGILQGIITGKIAVGPATAWLNIILSFTDMLQMMQRAGS